MLADATPLIVRFKLALLDAHSDRVTRTTPRDGDAGRFRHHGFASEREFWNVALSEPMAAIDFVGMLSGFFCPWTEDATGRKIKTIILKRVLLEAFDAREPWVYLSSREVVCRGVQSLHLRPREAAEWLAKPMRQHLLPAGLIAHLDQTDLNLIEGKAVRRGPSPAKLSAVMDAMRSYSSEELLGMKLTVLHSMFKGPQNASQSTCRNARDLLIDERAE